MTLESAVTLLIETLVSGSFYYTVQRMSQESRRQEVKDAKVTSEPPRMLTHLLKQQPIRQTHSWGKKKNKTDNVWNLPAFCCLISPSQASLNCVESQPEADVQKSADASSRQGLVSRLRILTRGSLRIIFLQTFWYSTC